jgi:hypothetical protein
LVLSTISYTFTSISNVISLVGATADIYIVFFMPSNIITNRIFLVLLYLKYKQKWDIKRYCAIGLLIISSLIGIAYILIDIGTYFDDTTI